MSDLVLRELRRLAHTPSHEDVLARVKRRTRVGGPAPAESIASERDRR